jgi:tRNA G18 (ribose-2'-O)-methylase SpoU
MSTSSQTRQQLQGPAAIACALDDGAAIRFVLLLDSSTCEESAQVVERAEQLGISVRRIGAREMRRLVPFGVVNQVVALVGPPVSSNLGEVMEQAGVVWLLAGCTYPGNVGFAIRSAEVSGAAAVVVASDFDRTERRDCLRYGMRVDRFFPVLFESAEDTVALAREAGRTVVAVEDVGKHAPWEVDLRGPVLIIVGGEEAGISEALRSQADAIVRVPMHGFLPSYNLQAAMAIVMGERLRQAEDV